MSCEKAISLNGTVCLNTFQFPQTAVLHDTEQDSDSDQDEDLLYTVY